MAANFEEMRSDAVRRVQEMHRRSQNYVNMSNRPPEAPPKPPKPPAEEPHTKPLGAENVKPPPAQNPPPYRNVSSTASRNRNQRANVNNRRNHRPTGRNDTPPPKAPPPKAAAPEPKPHEEEKHFSENSAKHGAFDFSKLLNGLLSGKNIEEDRVILVIMLILLAKDGADTKLLIALGYLLL